MLGVRVGPSDSLLSAAFDFDEMTTDQIRGTWLSPSWQSAFARSFADLKISSPFHVGHFLFDDTDVETARVRREVCKSSDQDPEMSMATQVKHLNIYQNGGLAWPPNFSSNPTLGPAVEGLPKRQAEVAWFFSKAASLREPPRHESLGSTGADASNVGGVDADAKEQLIDLHPQIDFGSKSRDCPSVIGTSRLWATRRKRLLTGFREIAKLLYSSRGHTEDHMLGARDPPRPASQEERFCRIALSRDRIQTHVSVERIRRFFRFRSLRSAPSRSEVRALGLTGFPYAAHIFGSRAGANLTQCTLRLGGERTQRLCASPSIDMFACYSRDQRFECEAHGA